MDALRIVDACTEEHFRAMSHIHALGWKDTYRGAVPDDYLDREITDDRWVKVFRENYETGNGVKGILLYRNDTPVSCLNYCKARIDNFNTDEKDEWKFLNEKYAGWGEIASFYSLPGEQSRGYGSLLMEEALRRLKTAGHKNAFVFVLRENEKARRFYTRHGFAWDGTHADIRFPHDTVCVDLRYVREL